MKATWSDDDHEAIITMDRRRTSRALVRADRAQRPFALKTAEWPRRVYLYIFRATRSNLMVIWHGPTGRIGAIKLYWAMDGHIADLSSTHRNTNVQAEHDIVARLPNSETFEVPWSPVSPLMLFVGLGFPMDRLDWRHAASSARIKLCLESHTTPHSALKHGIGAEGFVPSSASSHLTTRSLHRACSLDQGPGVGQMSCGMSIKIV